MLRYTTDRARPGLVAFYGIQPGNGAGLFLQPRNPHWVQEGHQAKITPMHQKSPSLCTGTA